MKVPRYTKEEMRKKMVIFKECKNCDCRIAKGIDKRYYHVSPLGRWMRYTNKCTKPEPRESVSQ